MSQVGEGATMPPRKKLITVIRNGRRQVYRADAAADAVGGQAAADRSTVKLYKACEVSPKQRYFTPFT